jgi:hypothetical protein
MKNFIYISVVLFFIFCACGGSELTSEAKEFIEVNEFEATDVSNLELEEAQKIQESQVKLLDSLLFEKSIFKDVGCSRDFWFGRQGPDCCCEAILQKYAQVIEPLRPGKIAIINAKDPVLKKCRQSMKGWGKRFDLLTNPKFDSEVPPEDDPGI